MTALVIKNLPDDVLAGLKERAKANHRSVTKEAIVLLAEGVGRTTFPLLARAPLPAPYVLPAAVPSIDDIDDAMHARADGVWPPSDGRDALRAALVKQPDGSYVNVLGIDDESFFDTLDRVRSELRFPDLPDFGDPKR